jgi:hypothetical protein
LPPHWGRSRSMGTTDGRGYSSVRNDSTIPLVRFVVPASANRRLVEGIMTVLFGILCFFFMPNTPADAGFLTDEERQHALHRMRLDASGSTALDIHEEKLTWHWVKMALMAPQTYLCSAIWFFLLVPLYVCIPSIPCCVLVILPG